MSICLEAAHGNEFMAFRDYDSHWEALGLKIAERVKVLAAFNEGEYLWQSGRLCDLCVPVTARAVVLAAMNVDHYHSCIEDLTSHAIVGSCASISIGLIHERFTHMVLVSYFREDAA